MFPRFISQDDRVMPGIRRVASVAQPAAGADWSLTVAGGQLWRLVSAVASLTTSATVANRNVGYSVTIAGQIVVRTVGNGNLVASTTTINCFTGMNGIGYQTVPGAAQVVSTGALWMPEGSAFGSATTNLQAGDQWTSVQMFIEQLYVTDNELSDMSEHASQSVAVESGLGKQSLGV